MGRHGFLRELWLFFRQLPSASWALQWRMLFAVLSIPTAMGMLAQAVPLPSGWTSNTMTGGIAGLATGVWIVAFAFAYRIRPGQFDDDYPPIAMIRPMVQSAFFPALLLGVVFAVGTPVSAAKAIVFTLAGVGWYALGMGALWATTMPAQRRRAKRFPSGASIADGFQGVWLFSRGCPNEC